jgi:hypothetical protein
MTSKFIPLSRRTRLRSVVVYPGTGYGTQSFVEGRLTQNVFPLQGEVPVLVVIAPSYTTPWSEVASDIAEYAASTGIDIEPGALIGWSGGARGVRDAISSGHDFPTVLLADPSPLKGSTDDPRVRMWYQPSNWRGSLAHLGPQQAELAAPMGGRAQVVDLDHNEILDMVVETAIKEQSSRSAIPWMWILPAGAVLLSAWAWGRNQ